MDSIVGVFTNLPNSSAKKDDDFVDRVNSRYTVIILVVFALVVSMHQYVGTPIPVHFTGSHTKYANSYCWVRNTYYLPWEDNVPKLGQRDNLRMVPYYQWIPFILLTQAVLFYLPSVFWHALNSQAGVDADSILAAANNFNKAEKVEDRESTLTMIRNQMDRFLSSRKGVGRETWRVRMTQRNCLGRRFGAYLVVLYIMTKVLYVVNVVGQLFLLDKLLGTEYSVYGFHVMRWMVQDHDWTNSPFVAFPRVTLCNFNVRRLGNLHPYTIQCTLPINLYNEKIYMMLWFWMVALAALSIFSLILWIARAASVADKTRYVQGHLKFLDRLDGEEDIKKASEFTRRYLRADGVFLLRLVGHNTNSLTVSEIIAALWDAWPGRKAVANHPDPPVPSAPPVSDPGYPALPLPEKPPLPE